MRRILATAMALLLTLCPMPQAAADDVGPFVLPVQSEVIRGFDNPSTPWGAGHRGVDLAAEVGTEVRAAADGVVSFAGTIAGRGVVSITHDPARRLRTTYEPLVPHVEVGQAVRAGEVIGTVDYSPTGHVGLHWGLIDGDTYLDPLLHLAAGSSRPVRLLPLDASPRPAPAPASGPGGGTRPADGPITSPFGMRLHPVLGVWRLHDGVDIGAPCGAPVRSMAPGVVVRVERHVAYGNRVIVQHDDGRRSGYAHLSSFAVSLGQRLDAGQLVGAVGTTGWSTGCHLHFMVWVNGEVVDPAPLL